MTPFDRSIECRISKRPRAGAATRIARRDLRFLDCLNLWARLCRGLVSQHHLFIGQFFSPSLFCPSRASIPLITHVSNDNCFNGILAIVIRTAVKRLLRTSYTRFGRPVN
ncbi:hypothetical protein EVAR_85517_1 [Eumeta japonica]|uniref:Uncharacterized protein n=1 Tax=Eumeta variegata TaxID=151549 RepID=A0A4C1VCB9_EUMVA|nr:hypothetical protein EVAR_85517_1 [Eumeta japonica]